MRSARREYGFLVLILLVLTSSTVAWTLADRTPPAWDPADHIRTAYDFYSPLANGQFSGFYHEFFQASHAYAPLFHFMTAGIFLVFGASRLAGTSVNFVALGVILFSVKWIGGKLHPASAWPGEWTGWIAALLTVCYHFPAWLIHDAFLDYLLMAMVTFAFAMLLRAGDFHVRKDAVLFGIVAGLGMLTKQTFPFFFVLPAAYLLIRTLLHRDRKAMANLFLAAVITAAIASIWYVPHWNDVIGIYRVNVANAPEHDGAVFSARSLGYYWVVLCDLQLQLPFSVLFIVGAIYSVRRRARQDWMLYLWILSGILSFTLIANKNTRYTVPILPAVALLSISWLSKSGLKFRSLAGAAITLCALASFFNAQWPSEKRDSRLSVLGQPLYFFAGNIFEFDHRPSVEDWGVSEVVHSAAGRLGVVPNIWQLNPSNVALYAKLLGVGVSVDSLLDDAAPVRVDQCDYVLARTHLETAERVAPMEWVIGRYLQERSDRFKPVASFALPHAQEAVLYKAVVLK